MNELQHIHEQSNDKIMLSLIIDINDCAQLCLIMWDNQTQLDSSFKLERLD